jgi:lipoyl(octanoyl) transferase
LHIVESPGFEAGRASMTASADAVVNQRSDAMVPVSVVRSLGLVDYRRCLESMRAFTTARTATTPDELWLVEHDPIYTVGLAGRPEHFPRGGSVPLERVDRGGQITYHGPGQAIVYCLIDLRRRGLSVRAMVCAMEQAVIDVLDECGVGAARKHGAPGVYVDGAKIAALGLRVRNGACYHGLALNVSVDLAPFAAIDPCGYPGMRVTRTTDLGVMLDASSLGARLAARLIAVIDAVR